MISIWKGTEIYSKHSTNDDNHSNNTKRRSLRTKERKLTNIFEEYIEFSMDVKKVATKRCTPMLPFPFRWAIHFCASKSTNFIPLLWLKQKNKLYKHETCYCSPSLIFGLFFVKTTWYDLYVVVVVAVDWLDCISTDFNVHSAKEFPSICQYGSGNETIEKMESSCNASATDEQS